MKKIILTTVNEGADKKIVRITDQLNKTEYSDLIPAIQSIMDKHDINIPTSDIEIRREITNLLRSKLGIMNFITIKQNRIEDEEEIQEFI